MTSFVGSTKESGSGHSRSGMTNPYPMDLQFERHVVLAMCKSASFYGSFAEHVEDDAFKTQEARWLMVACRSIYKAIGRGPGSAVVVQQRLRRLHDEGKISIDDLVHAIEYLVDGQDDTNSVDDEVLRSEFRDIVKRRYEGKTIEDGLMKFGQRRDMTEVATRLQAAESIGKVDASLCDSLDTLADDLEVEAKTDRLSLGCLAIDEALGGGAGRGELVFALAPPKTGKSLWLVERAVIAVREGLNVVAPTLELPSSRWRARWLAGLTGTPTNDIVMNPRSTIALERYEELSDHYASKGKCLGRFGCRKFPGGVTTLDALFDLVKRQEDQWGEACHVLVADYLDKLRGRDTRMPFHEQMREVYERTRYWAEDGQRWAFTASQTQGHVQPGEMPKMGDAADSQGKVRVTDAMIGLKKYVDPDHVGKVALKLLAVRNGEETGEIGPLDGASAYGVFLDSVAHPEADVLAALKSMKDDDE